MPQQTLAALIESAADTNLDDQHHILERMAKIVVDERGTTLAHLAVAAYNGNQEALMRLRGCEHFFQASL